MTFTGTTLMQKFMSQEEKIKKPVEAIQCANTFSLLQRKMYNVLLANASGNLLPDVTHRITMRFLCGLMEYRSNDYKTIRNKFRELRRMDIEWDVINEAGNKVWTNTSPLSLARVIEGEGICEYEFTPSLVPFLDRPAQYAKLSLSIQAKFKSCYGLALYENCERYRNIGHTRAFDVLTFRKLMGVGDTDYPEFFALKRRVISKAVEEVNRYADFNIEPEYKKKGRAVISIRFLITKKNLAPQSQDLITNDVKEDKLTQYLKNCFGLYEKDIRKMFKQYGRSNVEQKMDSILASESYKKGKISNMVGYLKAALVGNYQPNVSSKMLIDNHIRQKDEAMIVRRKKEELINNLRREYDRYLAKKLPGILNTLPDEERKSLLEKFEQYIFKTPYYEVYKRKGIKDIIVLDRFVEYIEKYQIKLINKMCSFNNYIHQKKLNLGMELER